MDPFPCLQTMTEENNSGTEVPMARKVRPMTESGMPRSTPMMVIIQVRTYETAPIQAMHMTNDRV